MDDKISDLLRDIEAFTCGQQPSAMRMLRAPRIDEWEARIRRRGKEFILVVSGLVREHPEHEGGEWVTTSAIAWFDRKMRWIRTQNRLYTLGQAEGAEIPIDGIDA